MLSSLKNLVSNKIFLVFGSALVIFVGSIVLRQFSQRNAVQKEISDLSSQAQGLQQKNQELENLLAYLQTDDYKQKAARQQLNLKKDGEVVYTFAQGGDSAQTPAVSQVQTQTSAEVSNPAKWWNYFFNPNN